MLNTIPDKFDIVCKKIKFGFIPLTDCAPLVAAKEFGLFAKYGVDVELSKEASWAANSAKLTVDHSIS